MKLDLLFCNTKNEFKLLFSLSIIILCYKVNKNFTLCNSFPTSLVAKTSKDCSSSDHVQPLIQVLVQLEHGKSDRLAFE